MNNYHDAVFPHFDIWAQIIIRLEFFGSKDTDP
jgi:hypothetical protein